MTPAGGGDRSAQTDATGFTAITNSWWFLDAVSVETSDQIGAVVALGDSITEGANSTSNTNRRWPDFLAARLNAVGNRVGVRGVVNEGISGNAVTKDFNCCGGNPSGLSRLDRDVLSHDGVSTVIVALGINDIGNYPNETVNVADITDGLRQIADRLHRADKTVLVATLTPFAVTTLPGYYSLEKDAKRMAVNQFIRSAPYWDGIVDFERALADPADPLRMLPAYDSGDHLHPNDAGMKALADAITWLDDPTLPIDKAATSVGATRPAHALARARTAGELRPADTGRRARVHGDDERDGHEHRRRRGAHRPGPGTPHERVVRARPAAPGRDRARGLERPRVERVGRNHLHTGDCGRRTVADRQLQQDAGAHALDDQSVIT